MSKLLLGTIFLVLGLVVFFFKGKIAPFVKEMDDEYLPIPLRLKSYLNAYRIFAIGASLIGVLYLLRYFEAI